MNTFSKTDHFVFRQWDRSIEDCIVAKVYPSVQCVSKNKKEVVFVMPSFLRQKGVSKDTKCLILIIRGKYLITGYWRDLSECFFGQKIYTNPQILS